MLTVNGEVLFVVMLIEKGVVITGKQLPPELSSVANVCDTTAVTKPGVA